MLEFEYPYPQTITSRSRGTIAFDPVHDTSHRAILDRRIEQWKTQHPEAATAVIDHIDDTRRVAVLVDSSMATISRDGDSLVVSLADDQCKPSKGDEVRAWYEKQNPGYAMTIFHPYARLAVLERMSDAQRVARSQFAAALGLREWDLRVAPADDGGWTITLDTGVVYQPSKMDARMEDACRTVGALGWWFQADPASGVIRVHPGTPPTFRKTHEYPFALLADPEYRDRTPFAVRLPKTGGDPYETVCVDWRESSFLLVGGEGGSGKSVGVNGMLASIIAQKPMLSIIDLENKSTDYYWARPWVTPGHWGCGSELQAAGVINRLLDDIERGERAQAWKSNAWQNWLDIPAWAKRRYPLHYVLVDEYASLVDKAKDVPRVPDPEKTAPKIIDKLLLGQAEADVKDGVLRLLRTARAQGYRLILISQTVNDRSGLGPTTRDLFGHHMVMGPNPSEALVKAAFHDAAAVPDVPANLFDEGVTKGVGRAELMGVRPFVFKTFYAGHDGMSDTEALGRALVERIGLPDGVDEAKYLDSLRRHGEDDPVDGAFMNMLTDRVSLGRADALKSDAMLDMLSQALDDARRNFGEAPAPSEAPATPTHTSVEVRPVSDGAVMDARDLARIMRAG